MREATEPVWNCQAREALVVRSDEVDDKSGTGGIALAIDALNELASGVPADRELEFPVVLDRRTEAEAKILLVVLDCDTP